MFALKHKIMNSTSSSGSPGKEGEGGKEQLFSRSRVVFQDNVLVNTSKDVLEITDIGDDEEEEENVHSASTRSIATSSSNPSSSVPKLSVASRVIDIETAKVFSPSSLPQFAY
jgi:hypothetical protein